MKLFVGHVSFIFFFQIILAAWLNVLGCALRVLSTVFTPVAQYGYPILISGQLLAAVAQPFVLFAPTKLAALWFPDTQRATANMIASMGMLFTMFTCC